MSLRVGINGFGRIGRMVYRAAHDKLDIVGINDLAPTESMAHLLKYDSSHGVFPQNIEADNEALHVGGKKVNVSAARDPEDIPWDKWEVDVVLECTGAFKKKEDFEKHLKGGVKDGMILK